MTQDRTLAPRALAAIAALALAAIMIGVGFLNTQPPVAVPAGPTGGAPAFENPCLDILAAAEDGFEQPLTRLDGDLPDDPDRIWLCGEPYNTGIGGPAEALTTNLAEAIDAFNSLERPDDDLMCTQEYRMTYFVAVDYPQGRVVLRGELHGCRIVTDGTTVRTGGDAWLTTLTDLWRQQRQGQRPPAQPPSVCPPVTTIIAAEPANISAGAICTGDFDKQQKTGDLDPQLVARIVATLDTGRSADDPRHQDLLPTTFVISDPWGSTLNITPLAKQGFIVGWADPMGAGGELLYWTPPSDVEQELRALL